MFRMKYLTLALGLAAASTHVRRSKKNTSLEENGDGSYQYRKRYVPMVKEEQGCYPTNKHKYYSKCKWDYRKPECYDYEEEPHPYDY